MNNSNIIESFSDVVSCKRCNEMTSTKLLRDEYENVPQPGYVGSNYEQCRVLLVGQNPGVAPERMLARDKVYTKALRRLASERTTESYNDFYNVVVDFVPEWPVNRNYFPLDECGLTLADIAYCNVVRCRTNNNAAPSNALISNCKSAHFQSFIEAIQPKVVVFIGKWAHDNAAHLLPKNVPCSFMNRMRSLSSSERQNNRNEVVALVKRVAKNA